MDTYCKTYNCKKPTPDKPRPPPAKIEIHKTSVHGGDGGGPF